MDESEKHIGELQTALLDVINILGKSGKKETFLALISIGTVTGRVRGLAMMSSTFDEGQEEIDVDTIAYWFSRLVSSILQWDEANPDVAAIINSMTEHVAMTVTMWGAAVMMTEMGVLDEYRDMLVKGFFQKVNGGGDDQKEGGSG